MRLRLFDFLIGSSPNGAKKKPQAWSLGIWQRILNSAPHVDYLEAANSFFRAELRRPSRLEARNDNKDNKENDNENDSDSDNENDRL